MQKTIEITGRNEDEAIASALKQLDLPREEVSIELVERAKSGFLGIGAQRAIIKVTFEAPDEPEEMPAKPASAKPAGREKKASVRSAAEAVPAATKAPVAAIPDGELEAKVNDFLTGLFERMGINAEITVSAREDGGVFVELSGPAMGAVIGRRGETLDAIQHLTNYAVNRGAENRRHVSIDAENYRSKREDSLEKLAKKMADKALKYRRSMALEPMNSYERHVIHTALQSYEGVTTCSTGTEPNRRVVISCEKGK